jgi:DNA replication protein DnaC
MAPKQQPHGNKMGIGSSLRKQFETKPQIDFTPQTIGSALSGLDLTINNKPEAIIVSAPPIKINPIKLYNHVVYCLRAQCKDFDKKYVADEKLFNEFVLTLSYYFAQDEKFLESKLIQNTPSLKKGLFIYGSYGFGKSSVMQEFQKLMIEGNRFSLKTSYDIKDALEDKKNTHSNSPETAVTLTVINKNPLWIDEIGQEGKSYGEESLTPLLNKRYDMFMRNQTKTHYTTNLKLDNIGEKYGFHIKSRIFETCNIIFVNGTDKRMI